LRFGQQQEQCGSWFGSVAMPIAFATRAPSIVGGAYGDRPGRLCTSYTPPRKKFRRLHRTGTRHRASVAWRAGCTNSAPKEGPQMLYWSVVFLIVALVAGLFGFGGIAGAASGIAQLLFTIFLIVFLVSLVMGLMSRGRPGPPV
jgi:uncharacterized membrane protein YtjA (UPF0391 family)